MSKWIIVIVTETLQFFFPTMYQNSHKSTINKVIDLVTIFSDGKLAIAIRILMDSFPMSTAFAICQKQRNWTSSSTCRPALYSRNRTVPPHSVLDNWFYLNYLISGYFISALFCIILFTLRCVNQNYEETVFYPAIEISRKRGYSIVEGMVGTYIEGTDGKMRPAVCGGHDTGWSMWSWNRLCWHRIKSVIMWNLYSGVATCRKGFVKCFLRFPQAVGLYCSRHATSNIKHITKHFLQVAGPDCILWWNS